MNKIVAIVLSLLLLNSATELHQLWKLPLLAKHYQQHHREDPSLSLFEFLKLHYSAMEHPNDNDDNEDNNLPFKSAGDITHTDIPVAVKKEVPAPALIPNQPGKNTRHSEGTPCDRSFSIFHPPCMA
ncbi:MAG: hypothetical protein V9F01_03780 [Chitinophagaceae bacterium]